MAVLEKHETAVGTSVKRKEDASLLIGRTTWVENLELPGTVYMAVVRSPYPHARIGNVDLDAARAAEESWRRSAAPTSPTTGRARSPAPGR